MSETNRIQINRSVNDSFRDKIANAISMSVEVNPRGDVYDMADAVIATLGIYEDEMGTGDTRRARFVTDWVVIPGE